MSEEDAVRAIVKLNEYCKVKLVEDDYDDDKILGLLISWNNQMLKPAQWLNFVYDRKGGILKDIIVTNETL